MYDMVFKRRTDIKKITKVKKEWEDEYRKAFSNDEAIYENKRAV